MKSLIKLRRNLVRKAPDQLSEAPDNIERFIIREITLKDINEDTWLNTRKKIFDKMLNDGQVGHLILNEEKKCIGYGWTAMGSNKPSHIPRIPNNSAWFHYERIKYEYQGKGIGRILIQERARLLRETYKEIDIYTDTSEDNISARINQIRLDFLESGIYYTIEIGSSRIPFLHGLFGIWRENKKHPKIKNLKYINKELSKGKGM